MKDVVCFKNIYIFLRLYIQWIIATLIIKKYRKTAKISKKTLRSNKERLQQETPKQIWVIV